MRNRLPPIQVVVGEPRVTLGDWKSMSIPEWEEAAARGEIVGGRPLDIDELRLALAERGYLRPKRSDT